MGSLSHYLLVFSLLTHTIQVDLKFITLRNHTLRRNKRKLPLLFNEFGVSQFVCGFGVPVDLNLETVTSGIVFKSQLPLPAAPKDFRKHTTHNINGRALDFSGTHIYTNIRWNFYKALESWASSAGLNGRSCVLKSLCEAAEIPFNSENGDLWHDIAHIMFTPFASVDEITNNAHNEYLAATKFGLSKDYACASLFKDCQNSIFNIFTQTF